jgi:hypothetical protein
MIAATAASGNKYKKCCLAKDQAAEHDRLVKAQAQRDQSAVAQRHERANADRCAELAAFAARLARTEEEDAYGMGLILQCGRAARRRS